MYFDLFSKETSRTTNNFKWKQVYGSANATIIVIIYSALQTYNNSIYNKNIKQTWLKASPDMPPRCLEEKNEYTIPMTHGPFPPTWGGIPGEAINIHVRNVK